jgi:C1A family cysteine protease
MWIFSKPEMSRYGWKPDLPDRRDHVYKKSIPSLPPVVDLRTFCPPVYDQGQLGSCTANALSAAIEFLDLKDKKTPIMFSRLFIYYNERKLEGTVRYDSGAAIRDGVKTLFSLGVCPESMWPYIISRFTKKPSLSCYAAASPHKIADSLSYTRLNTVDDMRTQLSLGYPFVFGFTVYESFEGSYVAQTGIVDMPKSGEQVLGGHAVLCVGYDDTQKRFLVRNSWGATWGMTGHFTIPYDYLADRNLSDDFWTIHKTLSE